MQGSARPVPRLHHRSLRAIALLLLLGAAPAQEPGAAPPQGGDSAAVVTQQERNELRERAYRAEREGRHAAAADAFVALHRADPDRIDWAIAAGRCLGMSGRFSSALAVLEEAHKRWPTDLDLRTMLARTLLLQTEREAGTPYPEVLWEEAIVQASAVLAVDPDHLEARLLVAQARFLLGDWQLATDEAARAAERHPDHPGAHVLLGRIALERFRLLLRQFEAQRPTGIEEGQRVAELGRQRIRARHAFTRATELDPTRAHPHVALADLCRIDGKLEAAREHLQTALAIDPTVPIDHQLLTGEADWQARRDLYASLRARYLEHTTDPAPLAARKAASLRFQEGRARLEGLDFAGARAQFEQIQRDDPDAENAAYYAFLSCYHLGDYDAAERHAATYARHSAPGFADVLRSLPSTQRVQIAAMIRFLGDRAYQAGRIDASRDLNHVTACLQDSADAWNNHAFLCRETGRFERAYASYQHAIEREPESAQLWNDAAVVLQYHLPSNEHLDKARSMYERAIELAQATLARDDATAEQRRFADEAIANARQNLAALDR